MPERRDKDEVELEIYDPEEHGQIDAEERKEREGRVKRL